MSKLIKVINNKDRYFNWVRKWQIAQIDETRLNYYLQNGFSLVREIEEKQNIVEDEKLLSKEEYQKILDHLWVKYNSNLWAKKLSLLVKEAEEKLKTADPTKTNDIESLKKQLLDEAIVEATELEGKTDDEIIQIATDNHLI